MFENCIVHDDVLQRSEEWFRLRAGKLTASNFGKIITPKTGKPSAQQDDMILELCKSCLIPEEVTFEGNFHTDRGQALENEARERFTALTGKNVMQIGFIERKGGGIGCSPDGLVGEDMDHIEAGLEIKCPLGKNHVSYLLDGKVPDIYKAQVHGSMIVTGIRKWYFISYCPGLKTFITEVEWSDYTDRLQETLTDFILKYSSRFNDIIDKIKPEEL